VRHFFPHELVAIITGSPGTLEIYEGPEATSERIGDALLLHRGIAPDSISKNVWQRIPSGILSQIDSLTAASSSALARDWDRYSNEETMSGALFTGLRNDLQIDGWQVKLDFVEFSKQSKEPSTGTDIAVVIDVLDDQGMRDFKTLWLQAKS
jgi:hypothetical protein